MPIGKESIINAINDSIIKTSIDIPLIIDSTDSNNIYKGFANPGTLTSAASWKIQKILTIGSIVTTTYADGNTNYDNIWDSRASLNYS